MDEKTLDSCLVLIGDKKIVGFFGGLEVGQISISFSKEVLVDERTLGFCLGLYSG